MAEDTKQKMKEIKFPKKYEASYLISDSIDRIDFIMTFKNFEQITNQTSLKIAFTNKPILSPLFFQFDEYTSLDYLKAFTFTIKNFELPFDLKINLLFKTNTIDNTTLFTITLFLENLRLKQNNDIKKIIKGCKNLCVEYIEFLELLLKKSNLFLYHYDSIIINCSKDKLYEFLFNFELMKKLHNTSIPNIKKEEIVEGKILELKINDLQKTILIKFGKLKIDKSKKKNEIHIFPLNDDLSSQEIIFTIISLSEEKTFFSITHNFNENVNFSQIKKVEKKKKYMFQIIKFLLEKKKEINQNIDDNEEDEEDTVENERECKSDYNKNDDINYITDYIFELAKNLHG